MRPSDRLGPYPEAMARPWRSLMFVPSEVVAPDLDLLGGVIREGRIVARSVEYRIIWDSKVGQWRMDFRSHAEGE